MARPTVQAIRHIGFEDLGSLAAPLEEAGYSIEYVDAAEHDVGSIDPVSADLIVILGGPIGAYDHKAYPVLSHELSLLRTRLAANRPTLGICLGAQLMAATLGARVYPEPRKEIGWATIDLSPMGELSLLAELRGTPVLHWHGDTFDLPQGCDLLASTDTCRQQAFSRGPNILGLQFHVEAIPARFEHWLIGHANELAAARIDPTPLREEALQHGPRLVEGARAMMQRWLSALDPAAGRRCA